MKEHSEEEFWKFDKNKEKIYIIDGEFRFKYSTVQYLEDVYDLDVLDAMIYVDKIRHETEIKTNYN